MDYIRDNFMNNYLDNIRDNFMGNFMSSFMDNFLHDFIDNLRLLGNRSGGNGFFDNLNNSYFRRKSLLDYFNGKINFLGSSNSNNHRGFNVFSNW